MTTPTDKQIALILKLRGDPSGVETFDAANALIDELIKAEKLKRYAERLSVLPESGGGGCHQGMLGVANLGKIAGLNERQVFDDLRKNQRGDRRVSDSEIADRVKTAFASSNFTPSPRPHSVIVNGTTTRHRYVTRGRENAGTARSDEILKVIGDLSPVAIPEQHGVEQARVLLASLYHDDEFIFIGERYHGRDNVKRVRDWSCLLVGASVDYSQFVINPLTGEQGKTKDGKESYRSDDCVTSFRYALAEFDRVPMDEQLAFWCGFPAPIAALIHSGGKSIHALIKVDCATREAWTNEVENELFATLLTPLGVDSACRNESRLSRFPGHYRADKGKYQRLLYLNPTPNTGGIYHAK
jgi:hypothetical protein